MRGPEDVAADEGLRRWRGKQSSGASCMPTMRAPTELPAATCRGRAPQRSWPGGDAPATSVEGPTRALRHRWERARAGAQQTPLVPSPTEPLRRRRLRRRSSEALTACLRPPAGQLAPRGTRGGDRPKRARVAPGHGSRVLGAAVAAVMVIGSSLAGAASWMGGSCRRHVTDGVGRVVGTFIPLPGWVVPTIGVGRVLGTLVRASGPRAGHVRGGIAPDSNARGTDALGQRSHRAQTLERASDRQPLEGT